MKRVCMILYIVLSAVSIYAQSFSAQQLDNTVESLFAENIASYEGPVYVIVENTSTLPENFLELLQAAIQRQQYAIELEETNTPQEFENNLKIAATNHGKQVVVSFVVYNREGEPSETIHLQVNSPQSTANNKVTIPRKNIQISDRKLQKKIQLVADEIAKKLKRKRYLRILGIAAKSTLPIPHDKITANKLLNALGKEIVARRPGDRFLGVRGRIKPGRYYLSVRYQGQGDNFTISFTLHDPHQNSLYSTQISLPEIADEHSQPVPKKSLPVAKLNQQITDIAVAMRHKLKHKRYITIEGLKSEIDYLPWPQLTPTTILKSLGERLVAKTSFHFLGVRGRVTAGRYYLKAKYSGKDENMIVELYLVDNHHAVVYRAAISVNKLLEERGFDE